MNTILQHQFRTALGTVLLAASKRGLCLLQVPALEPDVVLQRVAAVFGAERIRHSRAEFIDLEHEVLRYLEGEPVKWYWSLDLRGTEFQRLVWEIVGTIPTGETHSYSWVARALGDPKAVRAVGAANGANPVQIIVPCHRVVGANGALVGYGGGLETKRRLLEIEAEGLARLTNHCPHGSAAVERARNQRPDVPPAPHQTASRPPT